MLTAIIDEDECIGCNKCVQTCPVDAIIGAHQWTHTVLLDECIGCKLCLPPCPVDCIKMEPLSQFLPENESINKPYRAQKAKLRHQARLLRIKQEAPMSLPQYSSPKEKSALIKTEIQAALARVKAKKVNGLYDTKDL